MKSTGEIKVYGGPMHGRFVPFDGNRFEVPAQPRLQRAACYDTPMYDMEPFRTITYMVEMFREKRGTAYRETKVAVVEGVKNLLAHEEWEISRDMQSIHWSPVREPGFLGEFDSWFNWCVYRYTLDSRYLIPEFRKPRLS